MNGKELVFAISLTLLGGAGFVYSLFLPSHGTIALSPGLFPGVVSLLLFILSFAYTVEILRKKLPPEYADTKEKPEKERSLVLTLALFPFYLLILYYLHFSAATFIFLMTSMIFMHGKFRWKIPVISAASVLAVYGLFEFLLNVRLP